MRRSRRSTARCRHRIRPARTSRPRSPCRRALGSALRPGLASRSRRSVVANRRPEAPTPIIRTSFIWPTGGQRLPRRQPARRQQRELAHSGRPEGRRLSGATGCRRHSRTALASQRVANQRDPGRQEPMGVRRTQRHPGRLRSWQRRRHLRPARPLSLLRERQRHRGIGGPSSYSTLTPPNRRTTSALVSLSPPYPTTLLSAVLKRARLNLRTDSHCSRPHRHREAPRRPDGGQPVRFVIARSRRRGRARVAFR